jgi:1-acyl-sn-glycerol-3-phosphate acyltransferase
MKYLRTIYSLLFFIFFSLFVITPATWIYVHIGNMTEKKRMKLHKLIQWCAKFVMIKHGIPGVRFKYEVEDGVDFHKPHVVICNHQSHLDLMCQLIFTPKIIFLTNDWVWNNPFYGFLIRNAEYYPVADGIDELLPKLKSLVDRGYSIAIYPEGTRSKDCRIGRFHQGAFYVAEKLGLDVLPMYLYGPGKVLPKRTYTLRKSPIFIRVEKAVTNSDLAILGDTKQQASVFRKQYIEKYEAISNVIEQNV